MLTSVVIIHVLCTSVKENTPFARKYEGMQARNQKYFRAEHISWKKSLKKTFQQQYTKERPQMENVWSTFSEIFLTFNA